MKQHRGVVSEAHTLKAGCGIRYDPEQLSEGTGFDFSDACHLLELGEQVAPCDRDGQVMQPATPREDH